MKQCSEKKVELIRGTKLDQRNSCWLCEKEFKRIDNGKKPAVEGNCHLTGIIRGLALNEGTSFTRKKYPSFVQFFPISFLDKIVS